MLCPTNKYCMTLLCMYFDSAFDNLTLYKIMIHNDFKHLPCMLSSAVASAIFDYACPSRCFECYLQHQSEPSHITDWVVQAERARPEGETGGRPQEQLAHPQPYRPRTNCGVHQQLRRGPRASTAWQDCRL